MELAAGDDDPALVDPAGARLYYGTANADALRQRVRAGGVRKVSSRSGVPVQTLSDWCQGGGTSAEVLARIVAALDEIADEPAASAGTCGRNSCERSARPRSSFCCEACKKTHARRVASHRRIAERRAAAPPCPDCGEPLLGSYAWAHRCQSAREVCEWCGRRINRAQLAAHRCEYETKFSAGGRQ